jgi:tetratricopeptide (TPR) repeat protein
MAASPATVKHQTGWAWLQAGDVRAAERSFQGALKDAAGFYPAEAALGYVALAKKEYQDAVEHFDRAIAADAAYVPALVGRGEAQLALHENDEALKSFEVAAAADPQLPGVRSRIEVLRFRGLQDEVDAARKALEAGRLDEARAAYRRAIAASPQSPFLYRELAAVERKDDNLPEALTNAEKAAELDPGDPRALTLLAEIYEGQGDFAKAADTLTAAVALEPNEALDVKIEELREKAAFAAMPEEFKSIESTPTVTRAQLAALMGVRLDDLLRRARRRNAVVITDTRSNWAAPWILSVSRAGIMEVYPNHTFQPNAVVRRGDLAMAASRVLSLIAAENPRLAASWRNARRSFPDLAPGHLSYPAASLAIESGVMAAMGDGSFLLTRPLMGSEAVSAVKKLEELAEQRSR